MENNKLEKFDRLVLAGKASWWQMNLPSGNVFFGDAKAEMLGYPESRFKKYTDFTDLVHPDDRETAMQAMRDHLDGKKEVYEVAYRIQHKNGDYIKFYDCGKITKKEGENITVMGFVIKIDNEKELEEIQSFKELILKGPESVIKKFANT